MAILTIIVVLAALILIGGGIYALKRFEKLLGEREDKEQTALVSELRNQIEQKLSANQTEVKEATSEVNRRLDQAASYMMELNKSMGQFHELGKSMKDFQDLFRSQKSRGVVGEQVLNEMLKISLPESMYQIQYRFNDGSIVDAIVRLKDNIIPIDSKFSYENFRLMNTAETEAERNAARREFAKDVKNRVDEIAKKYILPQEGTVEFAVMYVPMETVYNAITEDEALSAYAQTKRVLVLSPNNFFHLLQVIMSLYQQSRASDLAMKALQSIKGVQVETERFGTELGKLTTHITNAKNMSDTVTNRFQKLSQKIENVTELELEEAKLIEQTVGLDPVSVKTVDKP